MHGGPSHVDLFDPKPELVKYAGKPLPDSFGAVMTRRKVAKNPLLAPIRPFRPHGKSGLEISDFLPHTAELADDLCVIRSLHGDSVNHPQSVYQMNTGSILMGHPSFGSWVAYGLGSENANMPAFVVLPDPGGGIKGGLIYGATDEFGYHAIENRTEVHDLHATMLHLMGMDHERLTYRFSGRDMRLTDVHGKLIEDILA